MAGLASRLVWGAALAAAVAAVSAGAAVGAADGPAATDWPSTNYDETANRYSPLDQITAQNVATLQQAWSFHLKPAGYTGGLREDEAIPLVIGNTMYLASPYGAVHALDATTGTEKWKFQLPNNDLPVEARHRLLAGRRRRAAVDHLRRALGRAVLDQGVGRHAERRVRRERRRQSEDTEVMQTGMDATYSLLSSPTIYKNLIIIGAGTGEGRRRLERRAPDPRAIRAPSTPGPASWSGPSTPCRGRESSATTPGTRTARRIGPASTSGATRRSMWSAAFSTCRSARRTTTASASIVPATTCSRRRWSPSMRTPASISGTSSSCITTSGTTTRSRRRCSSTCSATARRFPR